MRAVLPGVVLAALLPSWQSPGRVGCGSNIVSATVVATFCSHRLGNEDLLDLLILWRGHPGWFLDRRDVAFGGGGGSSTIGGGKKGQVSRYSTYGGITIRFDADFDASTVAIGDEVVSLEGVNTVLVDRIDEPGERPPVAARWTEPRLPLMEDPHVVLAQRSRELLDYLQCGIPMPRPSATVNRASQMPVRTVCEKLKLK